MKTEQEQIEQMIKIFTDNREVCHHMRCVECKYHGDAECMYSSYAYSLYQAGYGDVSEYKTEREMLGSQIKVLKQRLNNKYVEIERLKDDYAKLQEQFAQYQMASDKEIIAQKKEAEQLFESNMKAVLEIEKKQAQIDALNTARERCDLIAEELEDEIDHYGSSAAYSCAYEIKKLIKEVNNAEDKG